MPPVQLPTLSTVLSQDSAVVRPSSNNSLKKPSALGADEALSDLSICRTWDQDWFRISDADPVNGVSATVSWDLVPNTSLRLYWYPECEQSNEIVDSNCSSVSGSFTCSSGPLSSSNLCLRIFGGPSGVGISVIYGLAVSPDG